VSGHIPNAINIPFVSNLDENGLFLSSEKIKENYKSIFENKKSNEVIVHCGSGVTACHTLLAMAYAGFEIPKLYVGSWSEWSRKGKPIAKEIH
ncbi:MAG: rhodanese-like domain-containing protein, partial [Candidatus Paceibacterota bacterium]